MRTATSPRGRSSHTPSLTTDVTMRPNALRSLLEEGRTAVNAWMSTESRYLAEVLSHAGYDAVTVDLQHGMFSLDTAIGLLQAVSCGPATPMARCSALDAAEIGKLLDAGAYGIICPTVDSAADCRAFVAACRYPPTGRRSYGPSRGLLYGGSDYVDNADTTVLTWAMVESRRALECLDDILATPGLDGIYVGPNDLALDLGLRAGSADIPNEVLRHLETIVAACRAGGRWVGAFCSDGGQGRILADLGVDLITPGNDVGLVKAAAAERIAAVRSGVAPHAQPSAPSY